MLRMLSQQEIRRMMELAQKPYRPPQIVELKERIEAETRVAQLKTDTTSVVDHEAVQKIVQMKLELDRLYTLWTEGKIE